ncbi:MAG TPA: helix-turn-helix domain-containing protein [Candidatus Baltobacteraceae bacterium]|nr:helix-turn-helix domain-containing protein [Candidatus Baltobacteraceae bacterium]
MVAFQQKDLDDRSIGEALRAAREERGESVEDVERLTHVGKKFVHALEANDLKKLPEPVYAKKFVKALAKHYGIDPEAASDALLKEMAVSVGLPPAGRPVNFVEGRSLVASPILFKSAAIGVLFLAIIGYFAYSVNAILKPPKVTLYSPHDDQVFANNRVVIEGLTEPEVDLSVNSEAVLIEADGSFKDVLNLPPGVSHLRVIAKKRHSREQEILLKVVVEEPKDMPAAATTTAETAAPAEATTTPVVPKPKPKPVVAPPAGSATTTP